MKLINGLVSFTLSIMKRGLRFDTYIKIFGMEILLLKISLGFDE
ncbi:hypothetical protein SAMN02745123_03120 [Desulforamulus aeronauticus DSM 10349]|uniref:Uncharacterized protein n=1 Tax=Desulforamulus aeronauticus DSM 10349 TaxID=1121421 RepID=A0A1M6VC19_9FIRM|nr:hypothetical protein SAMN02745123_03120 [Desulforamulus aeronauticus DSM 10349]